MNAKHIKHYLLISYLELKMLLDSECWDKQIILLDITWDLWKDVCVDFHAVEISPTVDFQFARVSERQAVEEGRFSSSTCSHNSEKFSRLDTPCD